MEMLQMLLEDMGKKKNIVIRMCQMVIFSFLLTSNFERGNVLSNDMGYWPCMFGV
jgi:hypothetical protein